MFCSMLRNDTTKGNDTIVGNDRTYKQSDEARAFCKRNKENIKN